MENTNMDSKSIKNKIILSGTIVNRYETNKVVILTLGITQLLENREKEVKRVSNYPKVYFFKDDNVDTEPFKLHEKVKITGHISSSKRYKENGDSYISQLNVGDVIESAKTVLEKEFDNVKGGGFESPTNLVYLDGKIREIRKRSAGVNQIIIEAPNNDKYNTVTVTSFSDKAVRNINVGDEVSITGTVVTRKKEVNDKTYFYENVVASRIFKKYN